LTPTEYYLIYVAITVPGCIATGWWLGNKWRRRRQRPSAPTHFTVQHSGELDLGGLGFEQWLKENPDRPHRDDPPFGGVP
jgi:hypothetical protein